MVFSSSQLEFSELFHNKLTICFVQFKDFLFHEFFFLNNGNKFDVAQMCVLIKIITVLYNIYIV